MLRPLAFLTLAALVGCAASNNIPGDTHADATLKRDIYQTIRTYELATTKDYYPKVIDTTHQDLAGGASREIWTVISGTVQSKYEVNVRPSPQGGSDLSVHKIEGPMAPAK